MADINLELQKELDNYIHSKGKFEEYYPNMNIITSSLYRKQIEDISDSLEQEAKGSAKSFKLYLDTIIINMQTKIEKYKKSIYFDNDDIKDIENQGYTIPFYIDKEKNLYILLAIVKN